MNASVGRIVHYRSFGTPGGEYEPECRAAIITEVRAAPIGEDGVARSRTEIVVGLCVLNPTGQFFNRDVKHDDSSDPEGGTWHWPERVE